MKSRFALAAALVATLFAVPAPLGTAATAADRAAGVRCFSFVIGLLPDDRLTVRAMENATALRETITAAALPWPATSLSIYATEEIGGGVSTLMDAYSPGQRPVRFNLIKLEAEDTFRVTFHSRQTRAFPARLTAGSGTTKVYGVDRSGHLKVWTRYANRAGKLYLDNPEVVFKNVGLKALGTMYAYTINRMKTDVLFGITKRGALVQYQIPWRKPEDARKIVIRRTGFNNYDALSLGTCNRNNRFAAIYAIDKQNNRAVLFSLTDMLNPKVRNLVNRGPVAPESNWRLRAVL